MALHHPLARSDMLTGQHRASPTMSSWSRHSRRALPRNLSQSAFIFGARYAVRRISLPLSPATRANAGPHLLSLSLIRYVGCAPKGVASRSRWATQASVGWCVTPTCTTRRVASSTTKKA